MRKNTVTLATGDMLMLEPPGIEIWVLGLYTDFGCFEVWKGWRESIRPYVCAIDNDGPLRIADGVRLEDYLFDRQNSSMSASLVLKDAQHYWILREFTSKSQ